MTSTSGSTTDRSSPVSSLPSHKKSYVDVPLNSPELTLPNQRQNLWTRLHQRASKLATPQIPILAPMEGLVRRLRNLPGFVVGPQQKHVPSLDSESPHCTPSLHSSTSTSTPSKESQSFTRSRSRRSASSSTQNTTHVTPNVISPAAGSPASLHPRTPASTTNTSEFLINFPEPVFYPDVAPDSAHPEIRSPRKMRAKPGSRSGSIDRHGSQSRGQPSMTDPQPTPQPAPYTITPSFQDGSTFPGAPYEPISIQATPQPGPDYRKMGSPAAGITLTQTTSTVGREPSFESQLHPLSKAWRDFNQLPWVSPGRVTVSYRPGLARGNRTIKVSRNGKKRLLPKTQRSWYPGLLDSRSVGSSPRGGGGIKYIFSPPVNPNSPEAIDSLSRGEMLGSPGQNYLRKPSSPPTGGLGNIESNWKSTFSPSPPPAQSPNALGSPPRDAQRSRHRQTQSPYSSPLSQSQSRKHHHHGAITGKSHHPVRSEKDTTKKRATSASAENGIHHTLYSQTGLDPASNLPSYQPQSSLVAPLDSQGVAPIQGISSTDTPSPGYAPQNVASVPPFMPIGTPFANVALSNSTSPEEIPPGYPQMTNVAPAPGFRAVF